ncbi:MAG: polysaccharide deacetylase family protein [Clostridia bacterium]|nr:polysaccharide deacetylase family protein [Clostridia bacterium]
MKSKFITVITNCLLLVIVLAVSLIGFFGGNAVAVSKENSNLYYSAEQGEGVSLMFNVYEHTDNVLEILNVLDEYGAKSTFFIGGSWADDNVDCVREIYSRGHEIASHGYFHKDHSRFSYDANLEEIRPSVKLLNMICNTHITLFAPPSGAFNEATLNACESLDLKVIMWSRDTIDWRDKDADLIYNRATKNLTNGEFVLMHPTDCTVTALPKILTYIRDNGLSAVTVSQNLGV